MTTAGDLYKSKLLTEDALVSAVTAYLADPSAETVIVAGDHRIDVSAAVEAPDGMAADHARTVLSSPEATARQREQAVRTAVLVMRVG